MENSLSTFVGNDEAGIYTSLPTETAEDKMRLFQVSTTSERLGNHIGETISVTDVYMETVDVVNRETGELEKAARIIFITEDGDSYACVSLGVLSCVKRIFAFIGPAPWNPPLKVKITQRNVGDKKRVLHLEPVI